MLEYVSPDEANADAEAAEYENLSEFNIADASLRLQRYLKDINFKFFFVTPRRFKDIDFSPENQKIMEVKLNASAHKILQPSRRNFHYRLKKFVRTVEASAIGNFYAYAVTKSYI